MPLISTIAAIFTEGNETGSYTLELSTAVFVNVIGVLGNGEVVLGAVFVIRSARKYGLEATVCMFALLAGTIGAY